MTLQTEILSTETSDFLKHMIICKSFYSVLLVNDKVCLGNKEKTGCFDISLQNNPKDLDPSCKTDLGCLGRVKLVL